MLAHLLALIVALGSFAIYFSAFFFPEVHRKSDFYWSGLGLFYGLVLWICSQRLTGAVLLGQTASVALLLWFGSQTLVLRRAIADPAEKTNISQGIAMRLKSLSPLNLLRKNKGTESTAKPSTEETVTSQEENTVESEEVGEKEMQEEQSKTDLNN